MKNSGKVIVNELAAFFISQYNTRIRMKALGYTDSLENLDCITSEAFIIIGCEIDNVNSEESKRKSRR